LIGWPEEQGFVTPLSAAGLPRRSARTKPGKPPPEVLCIGSAKYSFFQRGMSFYGFMRREATSGSRRNYVECSGLTPLSLARRDATFS
jgi:hypothetical protein